MIFLGVFLGWKTWGYSDVKRINLQLQDYLQTVAKSNRQVAINKEDVNIARAKYHEAVDIHAPLLDSVYSYDVDRVLTEQTSQNLNFGVQYKWLNTGTLFRFDFTNRRNIVIDSSTIGSFFLGPSSTITPQWTSDFLFRIEQPLLREGLFVGGKQREINLTKSAIAIEDITYTSRLETLLVEAISLYWEVYLHQQNLVLAEKNLIDTKNLLKFTRKKVAQGSADEASLYDLEGLVADNEDDVRLTQKNIRKFSFQIASFMGKTTTLGTSYKIVITDRMQQSKPYYLSKDRQDYKKRAYALAKMKRQDVQRSQETYLLAKDNLKFSRLRALPILNADMHVGYSGRDESYNTAISSSFEDLDQFNYYIGLRFEFPLKPGAYRTAYERALHEEKKSKKSLEHLYESLLIDIEQKVDDVTYHFDRLRRYEAMVSKMKKGLDLHNKDFKIGKINADRLNAAYENLRRWQRRYLSSLFDYEMAYVHLQVAQGTFLEHYRIPQ